MMDGFFLFPSQSWQRPRKVAAATVCHRQWGIPGHGLSQSIFPWGHQSRLHPPIHVRPTILYTLGPLIHSIYIPPLPSSVPSWPSNVFRLVRFSSSADFSCAAVVCLCDSQSWRHPRPVPATTTTTYLSPSRPSTVAHHRKTEETFAAFSLAGAAEVIFGSVRIRTEGKQQQQNKKKRRTNKTMRRQAKQIHKAHRSHRNRIRHEAERRENDQRKDTTVGPRELAEAEEQRRWVSQEKINNSSVFSPPTRRFLLLFEFKPTAGARFRCVVIILLVDYCTGNLGQGVVKHKKGKKKEPDEVNVI